MLVEANGTRLWFDVDGQGLVPDGAKMRERPTVVLLHGGPGSFDHSSFKPYFLRLTEAAEVVYLDLRGHGRSESHDPAEWSFEVCADDVRAFCDVLGISNPIVYGHSLGGYVAMVYGVSHVGHPGALILQSTNARSDLERIVESFRSVGGDEVAEIVRRAYGGDAVTTEEWEKCWTLFGPSVPSQREMERIVVNRELNEVGMRLMMEFDVVEDLGNVECPTLVAVGEEDPVTPVAATREILRDLPEGTASLEVIEGAGHFPWMDAPERYWSLTTGFVENLTPT